MKRYSILFLVFISFAALTAGCGSTGSPDDNVIEQAQSRRDLVSVGLGNNSFSLDVTDDRGEITSFEVNTDQLSVGAALLEAGIISGDTGDYGLMVTYVNGQRADFTEDGAYWAFYIDGEFAMTGVELTLIEEGKTYAFIYTPAN